VILPFLLGFLFCRSKFTMQKRTTHVFGRR
jgi:hypothetical protein